MRYTIAQVELFVAAALRREARTRLDRINDMRIAQSGKDNREATRAYRALLKQADE
ncbi:MAG: hypothetical protein JSS20_08750 [Proteobacteria bacterium]|nr:hypothetical protein [Pseudomonadota bacterium]